MKKFCYYYLPVILWCAFIFMLSSQSVLPGPMGEWPNYMFKKCSHLFVYGVLYWLIFRAVNVGEKTKRFWLPFILGVLYAATDELHQRFVPGRTSTIRDIGYDSIGMGVVLLWLKRHFSISA